MKHCCKLLIASLLLSSFNKSNVQAQKIYKAEAKRVQHSINILPDKAGYGLTKKMPDTIQGKVNNFITDIIAIKNIVGVTAAVLSPGKGLCQKDTVDIEKPVKFIFRYS